MSQDNTPPHGGPQFSSDGVFLLIHERLARIETTLEGIRRDRDEMVKWIESGRADHEERLRKLERWRYMLASSVATGLVSAGVTIYGQLGK